MKIIVLSKTDYKEKDTILNAISENELISFKVRGGQSVTSPFLFLNNPLTIADVEFVDNPRYTSKILKSAKLLYTPLESGDSLNNLLSINLIAEAVNKLLPDEDKHLMFNDIESFFLENKGNNDYLLSQLLFLSRISEKAGYGLQVDECVRCGSKKEIVAFSFSEGGFICKNCLEEDIPIDLTGQQMKILRYVVKAVNYHQFIEDHANDGISKDDKKALLVKFAAFTDDIIGVKLNSIDLILKN